MNNEGDREAFEREYASGDCVSDAISLARRDDGDYEQALARMCYKWFCKGKAASSTPVVNREDVRDEMRINLFDAWVETDEAQSALCSFDELEIAGAAWDASKKAATASAEAKYLGVIEKADALAEMIARPYSGDPEDPSWTDIQDLAANLRAEAALLLRGK